MDTLEWLIMDLKIPFVDPTPEEQKIIEEYEKDKEAGKLEFKELKRDLQGVIQKKKL